MRLPSSLLTTALLLLSFAPLRAEVEFVPEVPSSVTIAITSGDAAGSNNWRWYHALESDSREFTRRDIGTLYRAQKEERVSVYGIRLMGGEAVAGRGFAGAPSRLEIFKVGEDDNFEALGEPICQLDFRLPDEAPTAGEWLVVRFPEQQLEKGSRYLFLLSLSEADPASWVNVATTRPSGDSSGVLRQSRKEAPPVWTFSKGHAVFFLGAER